MNDRVLVESLRASDPGALAALYDTYAGGVYRYCLLMTGGADGAQVALRDALIAAEAHVDALADPDRLGVWLYALARGECVRRRPAVVQNARIPGRVADHPVVRGAVTDGDGDTRLRAMAWNAVRGLSSEELEVLELTSRHGMAVADLAAVLGVGDEQAAAMHEAARERLRDLVTVEILTHRDPYGCAGRARIMAEASGELTPETRERMIRHVDRCDTCSPYRAKQVSADKVFGLLPPTALPETLRIRVMSSFADPELAPYRRYVARRVGALDAAGFPVARTGGSRRWPHALAGAVAAAGAAVAIGLIFTQFGGDLDGMTPDDRPGVHPVTGKSPGVRSSWTTEPDGVSGSLNPLSRNAFTDPVGPAGLSGPTPAAGPEAKAGPSGPRPVPELTSTGRPGDETGDGAGDGPSGDGPGEKTGDGVVDGPGDGLGNGAVEGQEEQGKGPGEGQAEGQGVGDSAGPERPAVSENPDPSHEHQGGRPTPQSCKGASQHCVTTPRPTPTAPKPAPTPPRPKPSPKPSPTASPPAVTPESTATASKPVPAASKPMPPGPAPAATPAPPR